MPLASIDKAGSNRTTNHAGYECNIQRESGALTCISHLPALPDWFFSTAGGAKIWRQSRICTALVQGDVRGGVAAAWGALCRGSDAPIWVFFPRAADTTVCQQQVGVQDRSYISRRVLRPENSEYPQNRLDVCHLLRLKHPALSTILLCE